MSTGMKLTKKGREILARGLTGEPITFTKVALGSGTFDYETESVYDLVEVREWQMDLPITQCKVQGDGTCFVEAYLSNAEVAVGFACREHAVIAVNQLTGNEEIFAYRNVGEDYDFIPSNVGTALKNIYLEYIVEIQDAENVTAILDLSVAYIDRRTFEQHLDDTNPHPNLVQKLDEVTETRAIWATDEDANLHQISLDNFKNLLVENTVANRDPITDAKNALGLEANILLLEDFKVRDTLDEFRVKVLSAAENGNLIAVEGIEELKAGSEYVISDGVKAERVKVQSLRRNVSGYHAKLQKPLDNAYDYNATFLFKTTPLLCQSRTFEWHGDTFSGIEANIGRVLELSFESAAITGDGFISGGYFTLA